MVMCLNQEVDERKKNGIQQRTVDTHSWHLFNQKTIMFQLLMEHSWFSAPGSSGEHCCPLQESLYQPTRKSHGKHWKTNLNWATWMFRLWHKHLGSPDLTKYILLYHCPPNFHSLLGLSLQQVDDWYMSTPWCPGEHLTVLTSVALCQCGNVMECPHPQSSPAPKLTTGPAIFQEHFPYGMLYPLVN